MKVIDIVTSFMAALEGNNSDAAAAAMDNNFSFGGWLPETLEKGQFLDLIRGLKAGIPDLMFNTRNLVAIENTNAVQGTMQVTGKHTATINLSVLRIPPIPPTGRSVSLPTEPVVYVVENNLITRMNVTPTPGGGIKGLLQQLGINSSAL